MKTFNTAIISLLAISFFSCDEELAPPSNDIATPKEQLLQKDWTYDYILMGTETVKGDNADSLKALGKYTVKALTPEGEPQTAGILEQINQFYRGYEKDHSYSFGFNNYDFGIYKYGVRENYQPNFGYWELHEDSNLLIHNKLQTYEKQFEIVELSETTLRLKRIGDRTSFLTDGEGNVLDTITGSWEEVFVPRPKGN